MGLTPWLPCILSYFSMRTTHPEVPGSRGHGFGTAPVFLAAVSTILGAILFLRFGYAVGHVGSLGDIADGCEFASVAPGDSFDDLVSERSSEADLVITGLSLGKMRADGGEFLKSFEGIGDILFVRAGEEILITEQPKWLEDSE